MDEQLKIVIDALAEKTAVYEMQIHDGAAIVVEFDPNIWDIEAVARFTDMIKNTYPDHVVFAIPEEGIDVQQWNKQALKNFIEHLQDIVETMED